MMDTRKHSSLLLVLVCMLLCPVAAYAGDAKVAVVDTIQASPKLKASARQAVAGSLDELGIVMVPLEGVTLEDAACAEPACFAAAGKRMRATHLLLVSGVANPAGYKLSLDVRDGESGRSLGTDAKDCELCSEDQLATTLQDRVTKLWKRVAREEARAKAAEPDRRLGPVSAETDTKPAASGVPSFWSQRTPLVGLGFAVLGAAGIGVGAYYIAVDGDTVETNKPTGGAKPHPIIVRDTGKWGWTFLGVGALSALAGTAMMIWGGDDGSSVSVAVGPTSLGLQGKF
jgi:hypothetical protein